MSSITKRGKGLRIKRKLEEAEVPQNKGRNEKTAVAMADDGSLPPAREGPVGPGQGQRPAGRARPAVQGAPVTYKTVGLQSSTLRCLLSLKSRFPWQPGPSLFQAIGKPQRLRLDRQPDFQPFQLSQKWLG